MKSTGIMDRNILQIVLSGARRSSATRTMTVWASGDVSETGAGGELPGLR